MRKKGREEQDVVAYGAKECEKENAEGRELSAAKCSSPKLKREGRRKEDDGGEFRKEAGKERKGRREREGQHNLHLCWDR